MAKKKRKPETTSKRIAALAAKGIRSPFSLTAKEIIAVCASVLTQAEDVPVTRWVVTSNQNFRRPVKPKRKKVKRGH